MRIPEKGTVLSIIKVKELSERGYDTYLIKVESTIEIILVYHYGGGIGVVVIDYTSGDGLYAGAFRNICEMKMNVPHDNRHYYFTLLTPYEIRVNKQQLEDAIRKIAPHFFRC